MTSLEILRSRYPWPAEMPDLPFDPHGWLCPDTAQALVDAVSGATLVVELGSWLGCSARAILDSAPGATLICIDHWRGSPEHIADTGDWHRRLPTLYETFLRNMWTYRNRCVPLRADTLDGMQEVYELGMLPDLVYVDSEHSVDRVSRELAFISANWPQADIVGDDYDNSAVALAADQHAVAAKRTLIARGAAFWFPRIWRTE